MRGKLTRPQLSMASSDKFIAFKEKDKKEEEEEVNKETKAETDPNI